MKLSRRTFAGMTGALLAGICLTNTALAQKQGGTLVMIVQPEPPSLASYLSTSGPIGMVTSKIYDGLLEYDTELQPQPSLAESWEVSPDGKSIHLQAAPGREVPRRRGAHLRRREVLHHEGRQGHPPARTQHLPGGDRHRDPGRPHRHPGAVRARPLHADGLLRLRDADPARAHLQRRGSPRPPERQQPRRLGAVQVHGVEEGPVHPPRPQPGLLEGGAAVPRSHRRPLHPRLLHPHRGAREGRGPLRGHGRGPVQRREQARGEPGPDGHHQGPRDVLAGLRAPAQHRARAPQGQAGAPGHRPRPEPPVHDRQHLVRVRQARHRPP